ITVSGDHQDGSLAVLGEACRQSRPHTATVGEDQPATAGPARSLAGTTLLALPLHFVECAIERRRRGHPRVTVEPPDMDALEDGNGRSVVVGQPDVPDHAGRNGF